MELKDEVVVRGSESGLVLSPAGYLVDLANITVDEAFDKTKQLVNLVHTLSRHNLLHADISYKNMIEHEGRIRLIDFYSLTTFEKVSVSFVDR